MLITFPCFFSKNFVMVGKILLILFYISFPLIVLYLGKKISIVRKIGSIVICYIAGLILGNINILPEGAYEIQNIFTTISIPLALPLILFSENVIQWVKMARTTFLSLILGLVSMLVMVFVGYYIFKDQLVDGWKIAGMLTGVYSGGTPNLAAISTMLKVNEEIYILTHTSDLIVGAFFLLFLLTGAQRFFLLFLLPYEHANNEDIKNHTREIVEEFDSYDGMFTKSIMKPLFKAFGIAILIFAIGGGISLLFPENSQTVIAILVITTLSIVASLSPKINAIKKTFQAGMYFILIFSVVVASMANLSDMFAREQSAMLLSIFLYVVVAVFGSFIFHALLSWIFKIDVDNFIITSVALSMSPPFVPVVAAALKNKAIVLSGLIIGIFGYAIGNYLGAIVAFILK